MVSRPRLLTVIFDEGVQTKGADIRSNHDDFTRVIPLHPGHERLHLSADLLGEGLSGLQVSYIPNRVLKKNPTVAIRETQFDWHCAEGAVFGIVRPPPVVVGGRRLPEEVTSTTPLKASSRTLTASATSPSASVALVMAADLRPAERLALSRLRLKVEA